MKMAVLMGEKGNRFAVHPTSVWVEEVEIKETETVSKTGTTPEEETAVRLIWKQRSNGFVVIHDSLSFDDVMEILDHALKDDDENVQHQSQSMQG